MIHSWLLDIQQEYNIDILFAAETGSRVWGGATEGSDYDIRFIYKYHDVKAYLSLKKAPETFSFPAPYDAHGWDLFKAFHLLDKSNPSLFEWVYSPIIYRDHHGFSDNLTQLIEESYSLFSLYQHYMGLMKRNVKEIVGKEFTEKRQKQLIQGVRSFLMAKEIVKKEKLPRHALYTSFKVESTDDRLLHIYHQLMKGKSNGDVLQKDIVHEAVAVMEREKQLLDMDALHLSRGKRITEKLDEWLWGLLNVSES